MSVREQRAVLVVEHDPAVREQIATWLMEEETLVMTCPGPLGPDYTCVGSRSGTCPLSAAAALVILDLHLASDEAMSGAPAWHLLPFYLESGKRVVALVGDGDAVRPSADDDVAVVRRPVQRDELFAAMRRLSRGLL